MNSPRTPCTARSRRFADKNGDFTTCAKPSRRHRPAASRCQIVVGAPPPPRQHLADADQASREAPPDIRDHADSRSATATFVVTRPTIRADRATGRLGLQTPRTVARVIAKRLHSTYTKNRSETDDPTTHKCRPLGIRRRCAREEEHELARREQVKRGEGQRPAGDPLDSAASTPGYERTATVLARESTEFGPRLPPTISASRTGRNTQ